MYAGRKFGLRDGRACICNKSFLVFGKCTDKFELVFPTQTPCYKEKQKCFTGLLHYDDQNSGKPEIILDYNNTEVGVDVADSSYDVTRYTKRWPMVIFFAILNIAGINYSMVQFLKILSHLFTCPKKCKGKKSSKNLEKYIAGNVW